MRALRIAVTVSEPRLRTRVLHELAANPEVEVVERRRAEVVVGGPWDGPGAAGDELPAVWLDEWEDLPPAVTGPGAFLYPDASAEEIVAAALAVAAGLTVFDPVLAAALMRPELSRAPDEGAAAQLTPRELEVVGLMAAGLPNKGIARALGISEHTAKYHVGAILSKLDAQSRAEAVMLAVRQGLVAL